MTTTTRPFPVPVRTVGPGSQPAEDDALDVLPMPRLMSTFEMPHVPERVPLAVMLESAAALQAVHERLADVDPATGATHTARLALDALGPAALIVTNEVLGEGEVSMRLAAVPGQRAVHIQESVFAGLWRCGEFDDEGRLVSYWLEAGAVPAAVWHAAAAQSAGSHADAAAAGEAPAAIADPVPMPEGTMNAPALLAELRARLAVHHAGGRGGQLNLSLLPLSPADKEVLARALPAGPVAIISRGFGNCHIGSTAVPGVWRQQFFNSVNTLILDLVEVTTLPEVVAASAEDLHDSRQRLGELVQWMRETAIAESGEHNAPAAGPASPPASAKTVA
ncbi:MAG: hydrogenase expression/formation protein [Rubrivivax sp.]|nr:hydrogenase expression/formation protein [Rubrivivax sp.]